MREDLAAWILCGTASEDEVAWAACVDSNEQGVGRGFSSVQTAPGSTRRLSSLVCDLRGRRMGIAAIIGFTKSPSELFGAVLRLGVMAPLIAVRSHEGVLRRKWGRPVVGAR